MAATVIPNSVITLYNRYVDGRKEKYHRSEIRDVVWQASKAVSSAGGGLLSSNVATVFIPFAVGTQYVAPKAWQALTTKAGLTLQEGDLIVRGIVTDEITEAIAETEETAAVPAFSVSDLRAKYDDVITITAVDAMDQGSANMRHWQVGCK